MIKPIFGKYCFLSLIVFFIGSLVAAFQDNDVNTHIELIDNYYFGFYDSLVHILRNNLLIVLLNVLGYFLFGFTTVIILLSNGYFLTRQFFLYFIAGPFSINFFIFFILPYMVLEIAGIILSGSIGLLGSQNLLNLIKGKRLTLFFTKRILVICLLSVILIIISSIAEVVVLTNL